MGMNQLNTLILEDSNTKCTGACAQAVSQRTMSYYFPSLLLHWAIKRAVGPGGPVVAWRGSTSYATQYPCSKYNHHRWCRHVDSLKSLSFEFQNDNADGFSLFVKVGWKDKDWPWTSKNCPLVLGLGNFGKPWTYAACLLTSHGYFSYRISCHIS